MKKFLNVLVVFLLLQFSQGQRLDAEDTVDFSQDILPLLAENCFACHGFDAEAREADLRLDTRDGATGGEAGHGVVVAGDAGASELVDRLWSDDPDLVMPPPETGKTLSKTQRELISKWIEEGASYDSHWAFVAPERPELPASTNAAGAEHPIDRFVQHRLAAIGLDAAPSAFPAAGGLLLASALEVSSRGNVNEKDWEGSSLNGSKASRSSSLSSSTSSW